MTKSFKQLNDELEKITTYSEPEDEIEEGEEVLGEMSDYLRRLHTLRSILADNAASRIEEVSKENPDVDQIPDILKSLMASKQRLELLDKIFWYELELEIGTLGTDAAVGVRKDYKIVRCAEEHSVPVAFLDGMIIGIGR